jgi:hypothetical protein
MRVLRLLQTRSAQVTCLLCLSLPALSCDDGLRLVVVEQSSGSGLGVGGSAGVAAGGNGAAGSTSIIPGGGTASEGGSVEPAPGGEAGAPDDGMAGAAGMPDVPIWDRPTLYTASFVSYAFPSQYMRRVEDKGFISPIDLASAADKEDATFEVTAGLYDDKCISFRAIKKPATFFRHSGSRIYMHPADIVPLYLADATFCEQPGLADAAGVTYRPRGYLQRALHIRNQNELWIDDVPEQTAADYPAFAAASTFYREAPLNEAPSP